MNVSKRMRMLGSFVLVVAISVATNISTNELLQRNQTQVEDQTTSKPAAYARFASAASAMETDFTVAAELSVHAVVHVKVKKPVATPQFGGFQEDPFFEYFFGPQQRQQRQRQAPMQEGAGSGVIISQDGYIVTNNHVADGASDIEVTLNDNRTFKAKLVGNDPNTDLALLKIDAEKLPVIIFGNSDALKVGEWVLAVGNPFNLTSTVTAGIVSAKARNINIINSQMKIESFIQTDAAVNPGNSGGALVNTKGELVGINTAIASQTGTYAGYAFAIPASIVQKVVADIRQYGVVQRAVLGVIMAPSIDDKLVKEKKLKTMAGVYVAEVVENSAAKKAGVKVGDVITAVNGIQVKSNAELQEQLARFRPGDKIIVTLLRGDDEMKVNVELKNMQGSTAVVSAENNMEILGASFKELSDKTRQQLGLDYGIEIKSLSKGKFSDVGIKPGFIILKINNQSVKSEEDVKTAFSAVMSNGDSNKAFFIVGTYPNGKIVYYAVDLADEK